MDAIGFSKHDHQGCISSGVALADAQCRKASLQLTPVRKRVLEILLERHAAMGAYDVLDILRREGLGSQPPVAYRALDFLVTNGFAHRVERLNAFVACSSPGKRHTPAFLICTKCNSVAEAQLNPARGALGKTARDVGFTIERVVIEAEGVCPNCKPGSGS